MYVCTIATVLWMTIISLVLSTFSFGDIVALNQFFITHMNGRFFFIKDNPVFYNLVHYNFLLHCFSSGYFFTKKFSTFFILVSQFSFNLLVYNYCLLHHFSPSFTVSLSTEWCYLLISFHFPFIFQKEFLLSVFLSWF